MRLLASVLLILISLNGLEAYGARNRGGGGSTCLPCENTGNTVMCLTCNAYREAGNDKSIVEVNRTVIARAESGRYPKSLCGVVYQRAQFSWTLFGKRTCAPDSAWAKAKKAAEEALKLGSNGKLNYYANYIYPNWARQCSNKEQTGTHIFCNVGAQRVANRDWKGDTQIASIIGDPTVIATGNRPTQPSPLIPSEPTAPVRPPVVAQKPSRPAPPVRVTNVESGSDFMFGGIR